MLFPPKMSSVFVYSNKILFLLAFGRIHDVNQLDDESQEDQNCEYDNHVSKANGKRAWSIHEFKSTFLFLAPEVPLRRTAA